MDDEIVRKVMKYLEGRQTISIPQMQTDLGLNYMQAHKAADRLVSDGVLKLSEGICYEVIARDDSEDDENCGPITVTLKGFEQAEQSPIFRDQTPAFGAPFRTHFDQYQNLTDSPEYMMALEFAVQLGTLNMPISTSMLQRRFDFSFSLAARIYNAMYESGYIIRSEEAPFITKVLITREELEKLKKQKK